MTDETAAGAVPADTPRRIAGEDREPPPVADEAPAPAEGVPAYEPDHEASDGCCGPPVAVITLGSPGPSCGTCGDSRQVDSGSGDPSPCPDCLRLVPLSSGAAPAAPARARHAAPVREAALSPGGQPAELPSKERRECESCSAPESPGTPMYDAGYALFCLSPGDCQRRQDAARAARTAAAA